MQNFRFSHIESKSYSYCPVISMPGWNSIYNTLGWISNPIVWNALIVLKRSPFKLVFTC